MPRITDLPDYTTPQSTDVLPIVDITNNVTKKITVDNLMNTSTTASPSQWILPSLTFTYVDSTTFTVNGDQTDIYAATRRLKINLTGSTQYSEVVSSSYNSEQNKTTITIADAVLTNKLVSVEHSIISPINANGAVTKKMLDIKVEDNVIKVKEGSNWISAVLNASNADMVDGFHASQTPKKHSLPVANSSGKLDAGWLPEDVSNADMVDSFHASKTPTANTIPVANSSGKLDAGWLPEGKLNVNVDMVDGFHASKTPTANTIPVANSSGKLDAGWLPNLEVLMNLNAVEFTSSGTWDVPSGVTKIMVFAIAGGGGGGSQDGGTGGSGGTTSIVGSDSGVLLSLSGGTGGSYYSPGTGGAYGTLFSALTGDAGGCGGNSIFGAGGTPGQNGVGYGSGGGGSEFDGGCGGGAGYFENGIVLNVSPNETLTITIGAGGSGAGGGGAGKSGFVRIIYFA